MADEEAGIYNHEIEEFFDDSSCNLTKDQQFIAALKNTEKLDKQKGPDLLDKMDQSSKEILMWKGNDDSTAARIVSDHFQLLEGQRVLGVVYVSDAVEDFVRVDLVFSLQVQFFSQSLPLEVLGDEGVENFGIKVLAFEGH